MMTSLIAYYSRTGNTEKVARDLSKMMGAHIERIVDRKDRTGIFGFLGAGWAAFRKKETRIEEPKKSPTEYDLLIIGTPVWAGYPTPAVRTYINRKREEIEEVAFFCTCSSSGSEKTFQELKRISGTQPSGTLALREKEIGGKGYRKRLKSAVDSWNEK